MKELARSLSTFNKEPQEERGQLKVTGPSDSSPEGPPPKSRMQARLSELNEFRKWPPNPVQ